MTIKAGTAGAAGICDLFLSAGAAAADQTVSHLGRRLATLDAIRDVPELRREVAELDGDRRRSDRQQSQSADPERR